MINWILTIDGLALYLTTDQARVVIEENRHQYLSVQNVFTGICKSYSSLSKKERDWVKEELTPSH